MATDTQSPAVEAETRFRVSSDLYRGLIAQGLIAPDEVALADGRLVRVSPESGSADRLYRMPLDVYERAAEAELLGPSDRVVLSDGLLVKTMARTPAHVVATLLAQETLARVVPAGFRVVHEAPLALPGGPGIPDSEPEPDLMVVRGSIRDFATRHPGPADVSLVVEVSRTTLRKDREALIRYARAGIPSAWVVNLAAEVVETYAEPSADAGYRQSTAYRKGESIPVILDGREVGRVAVADLLP